MGYRATASAQEDLLCAEIIAADLRNINFSYSDKLADLKYSSGQRFFNPDNLDFSPPTDFFLCTMINRFDFVLKANRRFDGNIDLTKMDL